MRFKHSFVCFDEVLPKRFCQDLIDYGNEKIPEIGVVGGLEKLPDNQKDISKLYKTRNSSIVWMNEPWIYRHILPYVHDANKVADWNFELTKPEICQWTKYSEQQHYTWHQDSWLEPNKNPKSDLYGLIRKLSVTVSLADGETYEGGDLEFDLRDSSDGSPNRIVSHNSRKIGSVVVFPSFMWHRVSPVTKGTRYSLVIWYNGEPFK